MENFLQESENEESDTNCSKDSFIFVSASQTHILNSQ